MFERQVILYMYLPFNSCIRKLKSLHWMICTKVYLIYWKMLFHELVWFTIKFMKIQQHQYCLLLYRFFMVPVIDLTKVFLCMCDRAYSFLAELFQRKGQTLVTTFILSSELILSTTIPKYNSNFSFSCQTDFVHTQCLLRLQWH